MTDRPIRIQRQRTKGWRAPPNTVYVGRPTVWGNPWSVTASQSAEQIVSFYRTAMKNWAMADVIRSNLRGKNIMCWCRLDQPCHADVLLEIANAD